MAGVGRGRSTEGYGKTWLVVAEGGWWTASEIAQRLQMKPREIHQRLASMSSFGYLSRRYIPNAIKATRAAAPMERAEYAVTPDCFVPRGLTAGATAKALGVERAQQQ